MGDADEEWEDDECAYESEFEAFEGVHAFWGVVIGVWCSDLFFLSYNSRLQVA